MNSKKYFDEPTQVTFWDAGNQKYATGIAYKNEVICGCCGGVINLDLIYELSAMDVEIPIINNDKWIDLSEIINPTENRPFNPYGFN